MRTSTYRNKGFEGKIVVLGFTEATIAALVGLSRDAATSRYIDSVDTALVMAADKIAGYIQGLLDGTGTGEHRAVSFVSFIATDSFGCYMLRSPGAHTS